MPHVFHPFADTIARVLLISLLVVPVVAIAGAYLLSASTGRPSLLSLSPCSTTSPDAPRRRKDGQDP